MRSDLPWLPRPARQSLGQGRMKRKLASSGRSLCSSAGNSLNHSRLRHGSRPAADGQSFIAGARFATLLRLLSLRCCSCGPIRLGREGSAEPKRAGTPGATECAILLVQPVKTRAFQALLKSKHTVNPTANRELISAARAELVRMQAATSMATMAQLPPANGHSCKP
jgi:hypothetical protein